MFWVPRAQDPHSQTRSHAVTGYLDPALARQNFDLLPGHRVNHIMLSADNRATPVIMQRSGMGPRTVLDAAGIDVRVDLPGVGMNLQDHPAAGLAYKFETDLQINPSTVNFVQAQDEYRRTRSGPHAGGHNRDLLSRCFFLPKQLVAYRLHQS